MTQTPHEPHAAYARMKARDATEDARERLRDAAPDLLAALEAVQEHAARQCQPDADPQQDATRWVAVEAISRAAIAKARGDA